MVKKFLSLLGISAMLTLFALNVSNALDDYGILKGNLSVHVLAQSSSSNDGGGGPGGGSDGGDTSDGTSGDTSGGGEHPYGIAPAGYGQACWDQPNNHNGKNPYLYCNKDGDPKKCTIYKHVDAKGNVEWSETKASGGVGVTVTQCQGTSELCPKSGLGCTVYSCHVTTNTNNPPACCSN